MDDLRESRVPPDVLLEGRSVERLEHPGGEALEPRSNLDLADLVPHRPDRDARAGQHIASELREREEARSDQQLAPIATNHLSAQRAGDPMARDDHRSTAEPGVSAAMASIQSSIEAIERMLTAA